MQEKLEKVIVKQHFHIFKQILIRAGGTWRGTRVPEFEFLRKKIDFLSGTSNFFGPSSFETALAGQFEFF